MIIRTKGPGVVFADNDSIADRVAEADADCDVNRVADADRDADADVNFGKRSKRNSTDWFPCCNEYR